MAFTLASREAAVVAVAGLGTFLSLHTADPGTTGANEATGGSPAYARQETTWSAGSADGEVDGSQETFDVPAGTYTHVGVWSLVSGGTFVGGFALNSPAVLGAQGQVLVTPTLTVS